MVKCTNCNRTFDDNFNLCPYCGTKKPAPKICPHCNFKTYQEFKFCPMCANKLISKKMEKERLETYKRKRELIKIVDNENISYSKLPLYDKIKHNEITNESELKEEIKKERRNGLIKLVQSAGFEYPIETELLYKINHNEITNDNDLNREIKKQLKKKEEEERKKELKRQVVKSKLTSNSNNILYQKINNNIITNEYELKIAISDEKRKIKQKEEERKKELKRLVNESKLTSNSKDKLYQKINNNFITNEYNLRNEIQKEKRKIEQSKEKEKQKLFVYLNSRYIGTNTKRKIVRKIENGEITTKEQIDAYGPEDKRKKQYMSNEEQNERRRNFDKARPMGMSWSDYLKH